MKDLLLSSLRKNSILKGDFVLSSGEKSDYYIDARTSTLSAESLGCIADIFYQQIVEADLNTLGGPSIGADPIVGAVLHRAYLDKKHFKGFLVRSGEKHHGTQKIIEGPDISNTSVAIVEDVVSTGISIIKTVAQLQDQGCSVKLILSIVDREMGAVERFLKENLEYRPIFKVSDLL